MFSLCPLVFLRVKEHRKDASKLLLVKKFFIFWLETSFRAKPLERVVTLFDMSEAGLSNLVSTGRCLKRTERFVVPSGHACRVRPTASL